MVAAGGDGCAAAGASAGAVIFFVFAALLRGKVTKGAGGWGVALQGMYTWGVCQSGIARAC